MGSLKSLAVLASLSAGGTALGAMFPDGTAPASANTAAAAAKAPASALPAPPRKYLEGGAMLYNKGDLEKSAKYLKVAQDYRDQLTRDEQAILDQYLSSLGKAMKQRGMVKDSGVSPASTTAEAPARRMDSATSKAQELLAQARQALSLGRPADAREKAEQADLLQATYGPSDDTPAKVLASIQESTNAPVTRGGTTDQKQKARWMLSTARESIAKGQLKEAQAMLEEVQKMDLKWNLFDDVTPTKVSKELDKARASRPSTSDASPAPGNRAQAQEKLRKARALIESGSVDEAEKIAREVEGWNLAFSVLEESPDKILSAAHAIRQRDVIRAVGSKGAATASVYGELVKEARDLMAQGKMAEAEAKASQAASLNAYPEIDADRAESVLDAIAKAKQGGAKQDSNVVAVALQEGAPAPAPAPAEAPLPVPAPPAEPTPAPSLGSAADLPPADPAPAVPPLGEPAPVAAAEPVPAPAPAAAPGLAEVPPPVAAAEPAPVAPMPEAAPAPVAAKPGPQELEQAKALMAKGNLPAARQKAAEAKAKSPEDAAHADELIAQIDQAAQYGAVELYESAIKKLRTQDFGGARAMLAEVAAAEGIDEGLKSRAEQLLQRIPDPRGAVAMLQDGPGNVKVDIPAPSEDDTRTILAQKLHAEVGEKVGEARRLVDVDPDKAIQILEAQMAKVKEQDLPAATAKTLLRRVEVALDLAKKDKVDFDKKMTDKNARAEIERTRLRIYEAEKAKLERFGGLMKKATEAMNNGDYLNAETLATQALEIDPNDVTATAVQWKARVESRYKKGVEIRDEKDRTIAEALMSVDEASVVPRGLNDTNIAFAKDYADLVRTRERTLERQRPKKDQKVVETNRKLDELITINAENQPLRETVNFLRNYTGLNIVVDPKALADEGLTPESPVTLSVNNIPLRKGLKYLLDQLGLTYRNDGEVLFITSPHSTNLNLRTETYYVADLVVSPQALAQQQQANGAIQNAIGGAAPGTPSPSDPQAMLTSLTGLAGTGANNPGMVLADGKTAPPPAQKDMMPLVSLITSSIAPGTWKPLAPEEGGFGGLGTLGYGAAADGGLGAGATGAQIGSITPFFLNISLIIRHTDEVHEQIQDLLRQLRRMQDLQVTVEVRFITVDDEFFEQIGVDFDFQIQSDAVGRKSSFAIPNPDATFVDPAASGGGSGGGNNTTQVSPYLINPTFDHALGNRTPVVVGRNASGDPRNYANAFTPNLAIPFVQDTFAGSTPTLQGFIPNAGAQLGISFLSDLEVYLFLQAAQTDVRSNVVQAPKVTTFNGSPAYVNNTRTQYYVAQVTPVVQFGAVAFQPQPAALPIGITLSTTPVVTADRRYVRLSLFPTFISNASFQSFTVAGGVGGGGIGGGGASIATQIQLPTFNLFSVLTTVTVPDGGTVLLGGVKSSQEERREYGVPILGKTPFINRLFRNVGVGRTSQSVMLMVTPRILILEEEEDKLGIPPTIAL